MPATCRTDHPTLPSTCSGSARVQVSKRTGFQRVNQATTGTSARQTTALDHSQTHGSHAAKSRWTRWMSSQVTAEFAMALSR